MKKHSKHSRLKKPSLGNFGRNEWAIIGAPCGIIQNLARRISEHFKNDFNVAFIDASHDEKYLQEPSSDFSIYAEKQGHHLNVQIEKEPTHFGYKKILNNVDLTLVNGNHFTAQNQIIILNKKKAESLSRKIDRLTNVILILEDDTDEIPAYLLDKINNIPVLKINDHTAIFSYLTTKINTPPLFGLVLNGGKSTRMGTDKYKLEYHGKNQLDFVYELLNQHCEKTFISLAEKNENIANKYKIITDKFIGLGAYGGILSAFQQNPDAAWLVVAIDMPNVDNSAIKYLIDHRKIKNVATAFLNPATHFPDPLLTIFEPKSYPKLLQYLSLGYACPRKMLINENTHVIQPLKGDILLNINTPEEKKDYMNE